MPLNNSSNILIVLCSDSLNSNGTQTIVFKTKSSSAAIPASVTQVGIDITLTGGDSALFENARGYFVFLGDDYTYGFDIPIEFKKSADGVVGFKISSVDSSVSFPAALAMAISLSYLCDIAFSAFLADSSCFLARSEERRVGKEC